MRLTGLAALAVMTFGGAAASAIVLSPGPAIAADVVNIYSYREPALIDPLLKAFTAKTGIPTNIVFANAGLNERLAAEGAGSPADILLTTDVGRLVEAKDAGLTQAVTGSALATIPASYRDADGHWLGLTLRARVVFASKARVTDTAITYDDLADPKWKGRICMRSGQHIYNTSLVALILAERGEAATEVWLRGLKANLARKPSGGDREAVRDVASGLCDLAIGNTYYMALMMKNPEQKAWADSVKILFPNAADRGSHVNISGVALTKAAKNRDAAVKLIEFFASDEAQKLYAELNNEYPINPKIEPSAAVKAWGALKSDPQSLETVARWRKRASELVDKVGFDSGPQS